MPKCVKCQDIFPPNYVDEIEGSVPMVDGEYPKECVFCKLNITEVEVEMEKGGFKKYSKNECLSDYKHFLSKVKQSKNVQDIINRNDDSRIILP